MTVNPPIRAGHVGLLLLPLLSIGLSVHSAFAGDEQPDPTIPHLAFRVLDVAPDAGPVRSFRYSVEMHSAGQAEPVQRLDVAHRSDDGILHIAKPYPPFGRIQIWIEADDPDRGYRTGYESFSYRIDAGATAEPATIRLDLRIVLTGKVLDAETGKPIAGADVAPVKMGHHFNWPDWDESAKTDAQGRFRVTTRSAEGLAARHSDYRQGDWDGGPSMFDAGHNRRIPTWSDGKPEEPNEIAPYGLIVRLQPVIALRGRVVDVDGKPIADVLVGGGDSDADGHFRVLVTREEWDRRETHEITFYAEAHRTRTLLLKAFAPDRETAVTLQREPVIQGQVLDEAGNRLEDCTVELKCESEHVGSGFSTVPGPYKEGKWQQTVGEHHEVFTLRVSVGGAVRSLWRYTRQEVTGGPIVTRLAQGHRLSALLVAKVPLDEKNTPVVFLTSAENDGLRQRAEVRSDGRFTFSGLADGRYTLRLVPASCDQHRGGHMNPGVGGFTTFGFASPNDPVERSIAIAGSDVELDPIDLHESALLPGRVAGVAFNPAAANEPFANAFGYVCTGEDDFDSVGGSYYLVRFMTDAEGRFQIDPCPPGDFVLRLTDDANGYAHYDPSVWIRVAPEKTTRLRFFAPEAAAKLVIDFVVGDGSPADVHAGTALDADAIARHTDPATGELRYIGDENESLRAVASTIHFKLRPLDAGITHWPVDGPLFEFGPRNLLANGSRDAVLPNVSPGRWRLTLTAAYESVDSFHETELTRDVVIAKGTPPLRIAVPAAALSGTIENPEGIHHCAKIEAIPRDPRLPTATCRASNTFRFLGLAPGEYLLRFAVDGCLPRVVENVAVRKGKTTWLEKVVIERDPSQKDVDGGTPPNAP